tara:strand:+ start:150 stop:824 length:675 start_codon:yes stop_codon:yes gene_type:complete
VTLPLTIQAYKRLGYTFNHRKNVPHVFGIRATPKADPHPLAAPPVDFGKWDDRIGVAWFDGTYWRQHMFRGTTDPGRIARTGQRGTAVMKPGQYHDAYQVGKHRGSPALVNWGTAAPRYWRVVADEQGCTSVSGEGSEYIGLNIHQGSQSDTPPEEVGPWSRGCQVIQDYEDWQYFLKEVKRLTKYASTHHGLDYITYTLLLEREVLDQPAGQAFDNYYNRDNT